MGRQWAKGIGALIMAVSWGCAPEPANEAEIGTTESALDAWVNAEFQQVLRVNAGETKVRNRCELTIPLSAPTPLTFIGSDPMGWSNFPVSVGWTGAAVSVPAV